ncbi:MAG TPA: ABC transporter C-terminal domain-containing protein, partial [Gemmatimonadaceae bacterium]|nr:ABC transporter C-terminal domain-containing protein [Gemmatimonadaceae bacterium]
VTDYHGDFAEWEAASAEREHAATVAAAEEEELRRVRERQRTRRAPADGKREQRDQRRAQRELEAAEAEVLELETRVASITAELEDPALYATPDGTRRATALGTELEDAKRALDAALARWETVVSGE